MQYISPVNLPGITLTEQPDKKELQLAKKKMLAELELGDGRSLVVNGREISKNDIVTLFDNLQQTAHLPYHIAVAKDIVLLRFLEQNLLYYDDEFLDSSLYEEEDFINWISPYFYNSFATVSDSCFFNFDDQGFHVLLNQPMLMNGYYIEQAWENIRKRVENDLEKLKYYGSHIGEVERQLAMPYCELNYACLLKRLPADRFAYLMDEFAANIMHVAIHIFNNHDREWARDALKNALMVAISEELKQEIVSKQHEMASVVKGSRQRSQGDNMWTVIRIFIFGTLIMIRMANSCNSDSDRYNFQPVNVEQYTSPYSPGDKGPRLLDSIVKALNKDTASGGIKRYY